MNNTNRYKVGVVFVNYNSTDVLQLALTSCLLAKTSIPWDYCVVDNGSTESECTKAQQFVNRMKNGDTSHKGAFIQLATNKGFAGGNNTGIKYFLTDSSITHIFLLNTDVIVSDEWLEGLLHPEFDVTVPVTNGAHNLQAIPVDIAPPKDETAIKIVNSFALHRKEMFSKEYIQADSVIFFAILIARNVFNQVGFLDESFFPGNFEDDDYCCRLKNARIPIGIIRDCYIHHWGSASFGKIQPRAATVLFRRNRKIFEKKWQSKWCTSYRDMARSYHLDIQSLQKRRCKDPYAWELAYKGMSNLEFLIKTQEELLDSYEYGIRPLREILQQLGRALRQKLQN